MQCKPIDANRVLGKGHLTLSTKNRVPRPTQTPSASRYASIVLLPGAGIPPKACKHRSSRYPEAYGTTWRCGERPSHMGSPTPEFPKWEIPRGDDRGAGIGIFHNGLTREEFLIVVQAEAKATLLPA